MIPPTRRATRRTTIVGSLAIAATCTREATVEPTPTPNGPSASATLSIIGVPAERTIPSSTIGDVPRTFRLVVGDTFRAVVKTFNADGAEIPVQSVEFSNQRNLVTVDASGFGRAVGFGQTTLVAIVDRQWFTAGISINVNPLNGVPSVSGEYLFTATGDSAFIPPATVSFSGRVTLSDESLLAGGNLRRDVGWFARITACQSGRQPPCRDSTTALGTLEIDTLGTMTPPSVAAFGAYVTGLSVRRDTLRGLLYYDLQTLGFPGARVRAPLLGVRRR